jgi:hypothetical protein
MSWGEFCTRTRQEISKRAEYTAYRFKIPACNSVHFGRAARGGLFFFSPEEVANRIALIKRHLPESVDRTIEEAQQILQHRFNLLGYESLDYGSEIDWHFDAVHDKRAPLTPWYKIRFLDFDEVGDHKITWELNRHQHFVTLAKAFVFTDDPQYVQEIEKQFCSWNSANPYPIGINWGSSLEVAFRSLSWIWARNLLSGNSASSDRFDRDLVQGLARNGTYIERYLSTYFSPNTHLIGEALALFFIGTLCPEIPASARWQQRGFNILISESQRQVRSDGVYFEQSLYYHVYALDLFLHARALAACNAMRLPDSFDQTLRMMLQVVNVLCRNGEPQSFGDDDGGRLFDPRRNRTQHMSDPLAMGACLFSDAFFDAALTEESIWIFGEKAVAACQSQHQQELSSRAFEDGGLYVIASEGRHRSQMLVDAGPHGIGHGGHGHADALSIRLSVNGRPWLIDPGTYVYISSGNERNEFRGTAAHNTLRVDGRDQAHPENAFSWSSLPEVIVQGWHQGKGFTYLAGSHHGYEGLTDPVVHRRRIFHLHGEYWLIHDAIEGQSEHDLEIYWHFAPDAQVSADEGVIRGSHDSEYLVLLSAEGWQAAIQPGYVSPAYGSKLRAPVGVFTASLKEPTEHTTLMIHHNETEEPGNFVALPEAENTAAYRYDHEGASDVIVFRRNGDAWAAGSITSDSEILFVRRYNGEINTLIFCSATFVEIDGRRVFESPKKVERFEWAAGSHASSSDSESLKFYHRELIRSGTPVR